MSKRSIYLASPLFNEREREFNASLRDRLSPDFSVFLPQEDGLLLFELIRGGIDRNEAERMVYDADVSAIHDCDVVLAVLDGAHVDEGVAFEIGYGRALGKLCVGLQTDIRRQLPTGNNPMISRSLQRVFGDVDSMVSWLVLSFGCTALADQQSS